MRYLAHLIFILRITTSIDHVNTSGPYLVISLRFNEKSIRSFHPSLLKIRLLPPLCKIILTVLRQYLMFKIEMSNRTTRDFA